MSVVRTREATPADAAGWLDLRCALWPEGSRVEHRKEIAQFFAGELAEPLAVFLAVEPGGRVVGLAELSIRAAAAGCETAGVGYLEGWFVEPTVRRQGVGRALVAAAEEWARARGCRDFASDTEQGNVVSAAAHRAVGFAPVSAIAFCKALPSPS